MTKIVGIFTEGGAGIGLGHLTRCYAIAYALQQRGFKPIFFICSSDNVAGIVRPFSSKNVDWKLGIGSIIKNEQVSFAIVDSYLAAQEVYEVAARLLNGRMLIIDDYMRLPYPGVFVVNPALSSETLKYPVEGGQRYLLGKDYIILRPDFWKTEPKIIKNKIEKIFLTLGGSADKEILEQIASSIKGYLDARIRILDSYNEIYSALEMRGMMSESDLCISGGGQTMYELARMGVPTVSVTLDDNQMLNAKALQEAGFSFSVGRIDGNLFLYKLKEGIEYMSSLVIRKKCSIAGQEIVDGKGASRLADIIIGGL